MDAQEESPLMEALREFEATEANLVKIERLLKEIENLVPKGIEFGPNPDYEDRSRAFNWVLASLPMIDGWKPECSFPDLNDLAQARLDANDIGEFSLLVEAEEPIEIPGEILREYRFRFNKKRRAIIQDALSELIHNIDSDIGTIKANLKLDIERDSHVESLYWKSLQDHVNQIATLLGSDTKRPQRWNDLFLHLQSGLISDFHDIEKMDWPSIRIELRESLYGADDPIPARVKDLSDLISRKEPEKELMANDSISSCKDNVFIVHGRNDEVKEKVAQFLKELGLEPIILHEQPNKGRTLIEKFEDHSSNVKYAVVLLTPDDFGGLISEPNKRSLRARQNVVFEMGHFFGSLRRGKVCALVTPGVERPSDIDGILYISLDQREEWKGSLFRELKAAQLKLKDWIDPLIEEMAEALRKDAINLSLGQMKEIPWMVLDEKEKEQYRLQVKDLKERLKSTVDKT